MRSNTCWTRSGSRRPEHPAPRPSYSRFGNSRGFARLAIYRAIAFPLAWQNLPGEAIRTQQGQGVMDFVPGGELSRRIRDGDLTAESELIRQFEPGLRVLLRRRTGGDHGLLQDLVQETLLVVIQRLRGN